MSESVLKLKVESSEYDAKLKKAAEGIRHLADTAHKSGGDLTGLEKSELDFIKALGEMETKSRTAAGSVNELSNTYKELTIIYNNLNEVEKADEGGKALAASLEQLKQRAQEAKSQLDEASKSLNDNEDASKKDSMSISDLTSKLGINIKSLVGWGTALGAAKVALDVMKDALFQSESNVDEWGRTVQASQSVYTGFLNSLNSGDFSGFLSNISNIVSAAKEAYNALDELGTRMTIINPERAKLQARQQDLRATIRTKGADSAEGKAAQKELQQMQAKITKSYGKESKMNMDAFEAIVRQRLQEGGVNLNQKSFQQFMKTFSDDNAFQKLRGNAKGSIGYKNIGGASSMKVDNRNTEKKLMDLFTDEWRKQNSGFLTAAYQAQGAAASNALGNARYTRTKATGGSGKGGKDTKTEQTELQQNQKKINDLTQEYIKLGDQSTEEARKRQEEIRKEIALLEKRNGLLGLRAEQAQGRLIGQDIDLNPDKVSNGGGKLGILKEPKGLDKPAQLSDKAMKSVEKNIKKQTDLQAKELKENKKEDKSLATGLGDLAGGLGQLDQGFAALGIDLGEGFSSVVNGIQGVATILSAINTVVTAIQAISAADAIIPLANGGIVPHAALGRVIGGNNYSGDNVFAGNAWVNSGELVLNKAQQGVLASELSGGGMQNMQLEARISGEQIMLASNNRGRRTGRGEIVQSRRAR